MSSTVTIQKRGTLAFPAELLSKYRIQPGDTLHIEDLDGVFILTPKKAMVPEIAREIEKMRLEAGLSMAELLDGLRRQREEYDVGAETE